MTAFAADADRWSAWTPQQVHERLKRLDIPWCVAAGWAIDLFLQGTPREHEDLEIAVPHDRFTAIRDALSGHEFFVVRSGMAIPIDEASEEDLRETHQTWVRDPRSHEWRLDVFREPTTGAEWVARRDPRLHMPYGQLILHDPQGVPFACPEAVLLFKAKAVRPKDQADFDRVLPRLGRARLAWLHKALKLVHPEHEWVTRVGERLAACAPEPDDRAPT